ncbi:hypothetical protein TNIN_313381 [Trichonephila inaurata madagascariensis]|uniref:Uncharacterized protein n=1 Tax=Trichonephila inaurata madagascariensis TaxID=2747483 RepID=A0A8X7CAD3_9ARAC|nr:hypothetical protein TNIN_313381 [Trichonephila inaurata madagascariensis]
MDVSALKKGLAKAIRQASQRDCNSGINFLGSLCHWLTSKGEEKLNNFFDRSPGKGRKKEESNEQCPELVQQLKDYFDNLQSGL